MDQELVNKLEPVGRELWNWLLQAKDKAIEVAPMIAHQIIVYGIVSSLFYAVIWGCLSIFGFVMAKRTWNQLDRNPIPIFAIFFGILGLLPAIFMLETAIQAYFAPALYIMDYIQRAAPRDCR